VPEKQEAIKNCEDLKMSDNTKMFIEFQSQIDNLSALPTVKTIYVPEFAPSSAKLQAYKFFGNLDLVVYHAGKELTKPLHVRTSKESKC
jgi:hypothetical protein